MQKIWKSAGGLSDSLGELLEDLSTWRETLKNVIMLLLVITLFFSFLFFQWNNLGSYYNCWTGLLFQVLSLEKHCHRGCLVFGWVSWSLVPSDTGMCLLFSSQGILDWGPDLHFSTALNRLRLERR